ncbi:MAG: two-component system, NarL family, sensor kinase [Thermoleophilaceae bacterium]|nr:two-component system, NarL family, sensor kinase [Thermoleophilaceae bacterium]
MLKGMRRFARRASAADASGSVAGALAQFAIGGLIATLILGFVGVTVLRKAGESDATKDSKRVTRIVGRGIVQPELTDALLRGDPAAIARVDRTVRRRVLIDPVVRVKIWTPDGRIVYSDEPRLIGSRYPLGADESAVLKSGGIDAEVSDLAKPENRFEQRDRKLLEVYMPVRTTSGRLLLFESYQRYASITASARSTWVSFLPALIGALLVLELVQLPLAARMARRIRRGVRDRERLLRSAIDASDAERRRIAADLHDGVVQSLAGVSFSLAAAADRADDGNGGGAPAEELRRGATATRASIAELRTLLVEIYPPSLHEAGLGAALADLAAPLRRAGVQTEVRVPDDLALPPGVDALFFRVAQEALRNIASHAAPRRVEVDVVREGDRARLVIADDGAGFDPQAVREAPAEGHVGLRLLGDLVRDAGGDLTIKSAPGSGTRVEAEVELT